MKRQSRPIRYAIYTRQSVHGPDDFSSCDAQFLICREFADASGEPELRWCRQRFDDPGHSGADLDRPGMHKLRKVVDLGGIDRVYAVALDRITRNMRDAVVLLDEFERAGIQLQFVHQPDLASGPQNRFLKHVLAAFAEFERDMITTRIAESRAYLKKQGQRLAGPIPFGYDAYEQTKQLVPNRAEARRVRAIFKRAANGQTPADIAKRINHLGWRTKQWTAKRSGQVRGGGKWTPRQVVSLLHNPVYVGQFADGQSTRSGCHVPIVNEDVFQAVQARLSERRTTANSARDRQEFALRGKVICPKCKRPLSTYMDTRGGPKGKMILRYYRCRSTAGGRPPCKRTSYRAWDLEQCVIGLLEKDSTWAELLIKAGRVVRDAAAFAKTWKSLNPVIRRRLLPRIVERVEPHRTKPEMQITFDPGIVDADFP